MSWIIASAAASGTSPSSVNAPTVARMVSTMLSAWNSAGNTFATSSGLAPFSRVIEVRIALSTWKVANGSRST